MAESSIAPKSNSKIKLGSLEKVPFSPLKAKKRTQKRTQKKRKLKKKKTMMMTVMKR